MTPANLSFDFSQGCMNQANHQTNNQAISSGYAALDVMLPHGGWPVGGITEIFCPEDSQFALQLLWPALARLSQAKRWLAMIAPPNAPSSAQLKSVGIDLSHVLMIHPHATSNGLWAVEHALRAGTCATVLSWVSQADHHAMQDLRGAALAGNSCGLIFRPEWAMNEPSAASLRLRLNKTENGISVELIPQNKKQAHSVINLEAQKLQKTA